jgi:hypothetical protein
MTCIFVLLLQKIVKLLGEEMLLLRRERVDALLKTFQAAPNCLALPKVAAKVSRVMERHLGASKLKHNFSCRTPSCVLAVNVCAFHPQSDSSYKPEG